MNFISWKEWERALFKHLSPLSDDERLEIADYYREIYGDKLDAGMSEEEILKEFGDPKACAEKILAESSEEKEENSSAAGAENAETEKPTETAAQESTAPPSPESKAEPAEAEENKAENTNERVPAPEKKGFESTSVPYIVGMVILSLLIILPLACVALGVISAFAATAIGGGVTSVAGIVYIFISMASGMEAAGSIAHIGIGLTASGIGILLAIGFSFATKYSAIGCFKALKYIYTRRKKQ